MFHKVRELYMSTMKNNPDFSGELDLYWFKHHFATVAHQYDIIHHKGVLYPDAGQKEDRARYNRSFGLVRGLLSTWLKWYVTEEKKKRQDAGKMKLPQKPETNHGRPILNHCRAATQLPLFESGSYVPPPAHVHRLRQALHERLEGEGKKN